MPNGLLSMLFCRVAYASKKFSQDGLNKNYLDVECFHIIPAFNLFCDMPVYMLKAEVR